MREIKFRGWDKELNFMINIKRYKIGFNGQVLFDNNDKELYNQTNKIELMQYTGQKDKNNVEIYEGDICSFVIFDYLDNDTSYTSNVIFQQGSFGFIIKNHQNEEFFYELSYILSQDDEVQVLGNIYENQDLIKG